VNQVGRPSPIGISTRFLCVVVIDKNTPKKFPQCGHILLFCSIPFQINKFSYLHENGGRRGRPIGKRPRIYLSICKEQTRWDATAFVMAAIVLLPEPGTYMQLYPKEHFAPVICYHEIDSADTMIYSQVNIMVGPTFLYHKSQDRTHETKLGWCLRHDLCLWFDQSTLFRP
jgi:hypothetical protein